MPKSRSRKLKRKGGALSGAPVSASLAGSWPSTMSQGQGGDYLKYHVGQHGGYLAGAPVSAIAGSMLPAGMQGPAHVAGTFKAYADVAGLKDQAGGRRKHRKSHRKSRKSARKSHRKSKKSARKSQRKSARKSQRKSRKSQRKSARKSQRKSRGGSLAYAPFPSQGMLLNASGYARAGLNPDFVTGGIEAQQASARAAM